MTIALLLLAAQGVSYAPPPRQVRRDVILSAPVAAPRYVPVPRGGFVPGYWASPRFVVVQPSAYGFARPMPGTRWIRYGDDALLVDRYGRVRDGRYGYDWRRHGRDWGRDRYGIPVYVGDGDFFPEERDYRWAERFDRGEDGELAYDRDYPYDFPYGGEGIEAASIGEDGYTITETTVTYPPTVREVTTYRDVVTRPRVAVRRTKTLRR